MQYSNLALFDALNIHNTSHCQVYQVLLQLVRLTREIFINSLAPGGFENIIQNVFFKLISWIDTLSNSCETALRSMPQNPSDDKSTFVQVMAWCRQAASHYLSQCCPRSLSPYGVTRPQWVKIHIQNCSPQFLTGKNWCKASKSSPVTGLDGKQDFNLHWLKMNWSSNLPIRRQPVNRTMLTYYQSPTHQPKQNFNQKHSFFSKNK